MVDAVAHCLLFLMQSLLCTKEVLLGDVGGHVVILLDEEWVGRRTRPIHHVKVEVSRKMRETKVTFSEDCGCNKYDPT